MESWKTQSWCKHAGLLVEKVVGHVTNGTADAPGNERLTTSETHSYPSDQALSIRKRTIVNTKACACKTYQSVATEDVETLLVKKARVNRRSSQRVSTAHVH